MTNTIYDINTLPTDTGEIFTDLCVYPGGRQGVQIERIVSFGDITPSGEWYDQDWGEWVCVLSGSADMTVYVNGVATHITLQAGDHYFFAPNQKHRVDRTDNPTIWIAVHMNI